MSAPEVGKTYLVNHSRKGKFTMKVTAIRGEWIDGEVVEGVAKAILPYNVAYRGESITVRDSLCTLTEQAGHDVALAKVTP